MVNFPCARQARLLILLSIAAAKEKLLALLRRLDYGARQICRGDFHPHNILLDEKSTGLSTGKRDGGKPTCRRLRAPKGIFAAVFRSAYLRLFYEEAAASQDDVLIWCR